MKRVIWTNDYSLEDWKWLEEEYPDETDYLSLIDQINEDYLGDEVANLNKELDNDILVVANLGLWDGRRTGWKFLKRSNLNAIFDEVLGDYYEWYVEDGELKCKDMHHDGTNYYTYRILKEGLNQGDFEEYEFDHNLNDAVEKFTEPMGHFVAEIYGWETAA